MPRGATCSLTSKAITIVGGSTQRSAISPQSRQTAKPHNLVSTFPGEGHFDPLTDKSAAHANCLGRFNPRLAGPYHRHRDTAQLRLRRRGKLAKIPFGHHTVLNSEIRQVLHI